MRRLGAAGTVSRTNLGPKSRTGLHSLRRGPGKHRASGGAGCVVVTLRGGVPLLRDTSGKHGVVPLLQGGSQGLPFSASLQFVHTCDRAKGGAGHYIVDTDVVEVIYVLSGSGTCIERESGTAWPVHPGVSLIAWAHSTQLYSAGSPPPGSDPTSSSSPSPALEPAPGTCQPQPGPPLAVLKFQLPTALLFPQDSATHLASRTPPRAQATSQPCSAAEAQRVLSRAAAKHAGEAAAHGEPGSSPAGRPRIEQLSDEAAVRLLQAAHSSTRVVMGNIVSRRSSPGPATQHHHEPAPTNPMAEPWQTAAAQLAVSHTPTSHTSHPLQLHTPSPVSTAVPPSQGAHEAEGHQLPGQALGAWSKHALRGRQQQVGDSAAPIAQGSRQGHPHSPAGWLAHVLNNIVPSALQPQLGLRVKPAGGPQPPSVQGSDGQGQASGGQQQHMGTVQGREAGTAASLTGAGVVAPKVGPTSHSPGSGQQPGPAGASSSGASSSVLVAREMAQFKTFKFPKQTNQLAFVCDPTELGLSLSFGVEVFSPGHHTPLHVHRTGHELFFILSGEGDAYCDGQHLPVRAGDLVVFRPGSLHGLDNNTPNKLYALQMMCPDDDFVAYVKSGELLGSLADEDLCKLAATRC
ncbi:hypothetical protein QJQ45_021184 [Haematococcus lacustris]|nr:hypothetical protein QJQ45_021184 [Haematococcus lacustris]